MMAEFPSDGADMLLHEATLEQIFLEIGRRFDYAVLGTVSDAGTCCEKLRMLYLPGKFPAIGILQTMLDDVRDSIRDADEMENAEDSI